MAGWENETRGKVAFSADIDSVVSTETNQYLVHTSFNGEDALERFLGFFMFSHIPSDALGEALECVADVWAFHRTKLEHLPQEESRPLNLSLGTKSVSSVLHLEE